MCQGCNDPVETAMGDIERYLAANPAAAESLDGITSWWVAARRWLIARDTVAEALDRLVAQGSVEAVEAVDGRRIYRRPRHG